MSIMLTLAGVLLLGVGLQDMFRTLLHPSGQGRLTGVVLRALWRLSRASGHRIAVGPSGMLLVLLVWVMLQLGGWALIYLPHVPNGFTYSAGIDARDYSTLAEALYLSTVTLTTLGYGDVVATDPWLRAVSPLEALTGFALLTAGLTWFSQIYPPLSRRRSLALQIRALADCSFADHVTDTHPASVASTLDALTARVTEVRVDFTQHAEGFFFHESDPDLALAAQVHHLLPLRDSALRARDDTVRHSGARLSAAINRLSEVLDANFLHLSASPRQVFRAFATEHAHHPPGC